MSTDGLTGTFVGKSAPSVAPVSAPKPSIPSTPLSIDPQPIPQLVKVMQTVKTDTPQAVQNKTSISDGNGGRIELNDQTVKNPTNRK
ncbi:hypothetical protein LBMAG33_7760 [Candidatus Levyibacteriota bacterium]|nr:hypothetical protein LBMAG33_7760 [Candidatus Levybacteria bacterium]